MTVPSSDSSFFSEVYAEAQASSFVKACRREPVERTPVWLMRQAGRYLPEYREIREKHDFLEMCKTPEVAVEVTLQPLRRFDLDASIIFADILLPLEAMGLPLRFAKGAGPVLDRPITCEADVDALRPIEPEDELGYVLAAVKLARQELKPTTPLIGFAGAPFTLASYAIEGGSSRHFQKTKGLMWNDPATWDKLLGKISSAILRYLVAQARAGAQVVQLFDSWVGCLSRSDYERYVMPHSQSILRGLRDEGILAIHFGTDTGAFLDRMRIAGGDVIGVDWRQPLDTAWETIGDGVAIQGNLDPIALFAPKEVLEAKIDDILDRAAGRPGHIFNLGHGVLPGAPIEAVETLIERVHARKI